MISGLCRFCALLRRGAAFPLCSELDWLCCEPEVLAPPAAWPLGCELELLAPVDDCDCDWVSCDCDWVLPCACGWLLCAALPCFCSSAANAENESAVATAIKRWLRFMRTPFPQRGNGTEQAPFRAPGVLVLGFFLFRSAARAGFGRVCRRVLLARELAVAVLIELVEILLVRRAFGLLARDEAVLVLVQVFEHFLRVGAGPGAGLATARARCSGARAAGTRARSLVAARVSRHGKGEYRCHQPFCFHHGLLCVIKGLEMHSQEPACKRCAARTSRIGSKWAERPIPGARRPR